MKRWLVQHVRAVSGSFARFGRAPFATLFNIVVVGVALALPVGLYTGLFNVQSWARHTPADPQLSVFLARDAKRADALEIERRLKAVPQIERATYIPRDKALEELKQHTGFSDILQSLDQNPLPDAFVVGVKEPSAATLEQLRSQIAAWPKVDDVQLDSIWAKRLEAGLRAGELIVMLLGTALAFALVAVTFNTIRLQILTRRADIEVARLIGATDAFIRRPFLYDGALLGIAGGLVSWGIIAGALALLNAQFARLSDLYGWSLVLQPLGAADMASIVGFSAALGWVGAWLSVSRHLAESN